MSIANQIAKNLEKRFNQVLGETCLDLTQKEIAVVDEVKDSIITTKGFRQVFYGECIVFDDKYLGFAVSMDLEKTKVVLLNKTKNIKVGDIAKRTFQPLAVPVGDGLIGRIINGLGEPLDNLGIIETTEELPIERTAKSIMQRAPVEVPLETGIKIIDAMIPIGRGQRELIMGDRQTGKTSIALDAILHQKDKDVICIYCATGQKDADTANVIEKLKNEKALDYTIIIKAGGNELPGHQFITPYSAMSIAEYFMEKGKDVLVVYDDLTKQARAHRELSLLLKQTPGREAYPGDIFYIHSRLLERATRLKDEYGGGSITALPIIETELENLTTYIPTNAISITDGQIYLSSNRFQRGLLPAIDIGRSVSRVGNQVQIKAYKPISQKLGTEYLQFEELETFSKFVTRLDDTTKDMLNRGQKIREVLKQDRYDTIPMAEQVLLFLCVTHGVFDEIENKNIKPISKIIRKIISTSFHDIVKSINKNELLSAKIIEDFISQIKIRIEREEWKV